MAHLNGQQRAFGVAVGHQVLGGAVEVVEHVLLVQQAAGVVPRLTVLPAIRPKCFDQSRKWPRYLQTIPDALRRSTVHASTKHSQHSFSNDVTFKTISLTVFTVKLIVLSLKCNRVDNRDRL